MRVVGVIDSYEILPQKTWLHLLKDGCLILEEHQLNKSPPSEYSLYEKFEYGWLKRILSMNPNEIRNEEFFRKAKQAQANRSNVSFDRRVKERYKECLSELLKEIVCF